MIPLFLGLAGANLLLLGIVFGLGLFGVDPDGLASGLRVYHATLGITCGLMGSLAHLSVYTYFMATCKWLQVAADKRNLDENYYVAPALKRKKRVLMLVMAAILATMLAIFLGAAADSSAGALGNAHFAAAVAAVGVNLMATLSQYAHIRVQSRLMDEALAVLNAPAGG